MNSSAIHIHTAFLPLYFGGAAFVSHLAGRLINKNFLLYLSYRLNMLTGLVTLLTCAFGGASIRAVEALPDIDPLTVKIHAWTAMAAFLLSLALFYFSYKAHKGSIKPKETDNLLLFLLSIFLILFAFTTILAFEIR